VIAPVLILWLGHGRLHLSRAQAVEAAVMLIALLAVGQAVFWWPPASGVIGPSLKFLCMPLLAWAAFRFDARIAGLAILEVSGIAVWDTLRGATPVGPHDLNESLMTLQVFTGVVAVTTLALAAGVSERKQIAAAVRQTRDELHEAMTELEAFSHSITHDLRSPVGAVLNYSAVLANDYGGQLDDDSLRILRRIRMSAESAARLLDQLTQYAWAKREEDERLRLDMTALAREVYAEFVIGGEDVGDVRFQIWPLPPGRGSPELLRCVLRNLLSNAIKYTRGRKERQIRIEGREGAEENTYIVTDNGIGFDPALAESLFEPFQRLSAARRHEGTGLGLAIVARILRRQHGRVWAESDGASGSRFYFTLPAEGDRA
jgi:signal transduction histidine kinase